MARFLSHSFPGRKLLLFLLEQSAIVGAACFGAAVTAALANGAGMAEGAAPLPRVLASFGEGPEAARRVLLEAAAEIGSAARLRLSAALPWALGASFACAASLYVCDLYNLRVAAGNREAGGRRTLAALVVAGIALALVAAPHDMEGRAAALGAILAAALAVVLLRLALPAVVGPPRRLLVVGAGRRAVELAAALARDAEDRVEVVGFLPVRGSEGAAPQERTLAPTGGLIGAIGRTRAEWVVVAVEEPRGSIPAEDLAVARLRGVRCFGAAELEERLLRRIPVAGLRASDLAFAEGFRQSWGRLAAKRIVDVTVAALGLLLAAPLLAMAAIAIRLDSPGPLFYTQERVGQYGRRFRIRKLRTMRVDAEAESGPRWAQPNDPRVTRVGRLLRKFRIDEIPQLLSVLRGEMSLVGPRPERPCFVEELRRAIPWYVAREAVPPGVTGWAQLRYPYGASVEDARAKLEYDLYYVKNGSTFLDLAILFHTVRHVVTGRGAR